LLLCAWACVAMANVPKQTPACAIVRTVFPTLPFEQDQRNPS
jgi:hypothetical protein